MIDRTADSFRVTMAMFTIAGKATTSIWGSTIRNMIVARPRLIARAASIWPTGTARKLARKISEKYGLP
jgi:hypothetical protein